MSARIPIVCHTGSHLGLYLAHCFQSPPALAVIVKSLINPNPTAGRGSRPCCQWYSEATFPQGWVTHPSHVCCICISCTRYPTSRAAASDWHSFPAMIQMNCDEDGMHRRATMPLSVCLFFYSLHLHCTLFLFFHCRLYNTFFFFFCHTAKCKTHKCTLTVHFQWQ